jgi:hypothetical protein
LLLARGAFGVECDGEAAVVRSRSAEEGQRNEVFVKEP